MLLRTVVLFFYLILVAATNAQDATIPQVTLEGIVVDQDGKSIDGATLVLASPIYQSDMLPQTAYGRSVSLTEATTNQVGEFNIGFSRDDQRFLQPGKFQLFVFHPEYSAEIQSVPRIRFSVDLPLEIRLKPKSDVHVKVVDASGEPARDVSIAIARSQNVELPFQLAEKYSWKLDETGQVDLPLVQGEQIQAVYAFSPKLGHQRLNVQPVEGDSGQFVVKLIKSVPAEVTFRLPDDAGPVDFNGFAVVAVSIPDSSNAREASEYSWANVKPDKGGKLAISTIGLGEARFLIDYPNELPYRVHPWEAGVLVVSDDNLKSTCDIELKHAVPVIGKVVNQATDDPIKNIYIWGTVDGRSVFTDGDGNFRSMLARGGTLDLFPLDASDQFLLPESFYRRTTALEELDVVEVKKCELVRSETTIGKVIDSQGQPVAGAIIDCERQTQGFVYSVEFLSDRNGRFQIQGCRPNEEVKLSAKLGSQSTKEKTFCSIKPDSAPVLTIEPQIQVAFTGIIRDQNGNPIRDAVVDVVKGKLSQPEGYSSKNVQLVPLFGESATKSTSDGSFRTENTTDFRNDVWVRVKSANHWDFVSPPIDVRKLNFEVTTINGNRLGTAGLGEFRLLPKPQKVEAEFKVTSSNGEPVESARVVIVGARTNKVSGQTDSNGKIRLAPIDGRQIVAIAKTGYQTHFQVLDSPSQLKHIVLTPIHGLENSRHDRPKTSEKYSVKQLRQLAAQLLGKIETPIPGKSSFHRMSMYSRCLTTADPAAFVRLMQNQEIEERETLISFMSESLASANPEIFSQLAAGTADPSRRSWFWVLLQNHIDDPDLKTQLLSEAVIASRETTGRSQAIAISTIAKALIKDGQIAAARDLIAEVKSSNPVIEEILTAKEPTGKAIGVARNFAPILALEDIDMAFELIGKNPQGQEHTGQQTQALLYLAEANPALFATRLAEYGYENLSGSGVEQFIKDAGAPSNPDVCIKILDLLPDSVNKAAAQVSLGQALLKKGNERGQVVLQDAINSYSRVKQNQLNSDYLFHPSASSMDMLNESFNLSAELRDAIAFEALWMWSGSNLENRDFGLPARIAKGLAQYDSDIARSIIEPCFTDTSWLHDGLHSGHIRGFGFSRNEALMAATSIDPAWGVELCNQLIDGPYAQDQLRQLELANAVCVALDEMIAERIKSAK